MLKITEHGKIIMGKDNFLFFRAAAEGDMDFPVFRSILGSCHPEGCIFERLSGSIVQHENMPG